jgi:hypothetical protein
MFGARQGEKGSRLLVQQAAELAKAGNEFLEELRGDLKLPTMAPEAEKQEHAYDAA